MSRSHPLSLANLMHLLRPLMIVDEAHESFVGCSVRLVDAPAARDPRSAAQRRSVAARNCWSWAGLRRLRFAASQASPSKRHLAS